MLIRKPIPFMSENSSDRQSGEQANVAVMPGKRPYARQPIDRSSRRSIAIDFSRYGDSETIADDAEQVCVDNFYHEGKFWHAVIPLGKVAEIRGQTFNFSQSKVRKGPNGPEVILDRRGLPKRKIPYLNHVQSRFILEPSAFIELYRTGETECGEPAHRVNDFVYSVEVVGPEGIKFNLRDGLKGSLLCAHRFLSTQEMVFERMVLENRVIVESPPLPLTECQRRAALVESLLRSHRAGVKQPYYLFRFCGTNNCTSNPFQVLDKVVHYSFLRRLGSFLYRLPLSPRQYLRARGMDTKPGWFGLVRDEFRCYIESEDTRERKRTFLKSRGERRRAERKR